MPPNNTNTTRLKKSVVNRVVNRVRSVPLGQISLSMLKQAKTLSTKLPKRIPAGILEKARALAGRSAPAAMFALTVALLLIAWKARAARKKKRMARANILRKRFEEYMLKKNLTENEARKMGELSVQMADAYGGSLLNKISHPVDTWRTRKLLAESKKLHRNYFA
jgi:hypothetical protein